MPRPHYSHYPQSRHFFHYGPTPEKGDRVRFNDNTLFIAKGTTGTIERNRGLGMVQVRLDDGRLIHTRIADLTFLKLHPESN